MYTDPSCSSSLPWYRRVGLVVDKDRRDHPRWIVQWLDNSDPHIWIFDLYLTQASHKDFSQGI